MNRVLAIALAAFFLNLPFGFLRLRYRKFSVGWFLCIHAPIPVVVFLRLATHTHYKFIPVFLATSVAGQVAGGKIRYLFKNREEAQ